MLHRRRLLAAAPALVLGSATLAQTPAPGRVPPIGAQDMAVGSARARVQVIEYASFSCPHCAAWHRDVWPAFKRRYVDSGAVRFALRELLTEPADMSTAGALLARCAPASRYYDAAGALFDAQERLFTAPRPMDVLGQVGARAGMSAAAVQGCFRDRAAFDRLNARVAAAQAAGITGTPTFVIGERRLGADQSNLADLSSAIDPLLDPAARARLPAA